MKTIILPGFSPHNRGWAQEAAKKTGGIVHLWLHWETGGSNLSLNKEIEKILSEIGKEKVNVIAKSVGTMVVMHLLLKIPAQIDKIILCGIPTVSGERLTLFKQALKDFQAKDIVCFQNTKDPLATFTEVKTFLAEVNLKIKIVEKPRSDHNYPYFTEFNKFLS